MAGGWDGAPLTELDDSDSSKASRIASAGLPHAKRKRVGGFKSSATSRAPKARGLVVYELVSLQKHLGIGIRIVSYILIGLGALPLTILVFLLYFGRLEFDAPEDQVFKKT